MRVFAIGVMLFAGCATAPVTRTETVVPPLPQALCAGWEGARVCELLQEDSQIRVLRCTFAPGVGHEQHYHPPHVGYVLEGNSVMRITTAAGVVERPLRAGTSFSNETEIQHVAVNVGTETMRYLIIEKKYADRRGPASIAPGLCPAR